MLLQRLQRLCNFPLPRIINKFGEHIIPIIQQTQAIFLIDHAIVDHTPTGTLLIDLLSVSVNLLILPMLIEN